VRAREQRAPLDFPLLGSAHLLGTVVQTGLGSCVLQDLHDAPILLSALTLSPSLTGRMWGRFWLMKP
jgi:hypothetical protein